jgi:lipopolysaccharide export system permease protein
VEHSSAHRGHVSRLDTDSSTSQVVQNSGRPHTGSDSTPHATQRGGKTRFVAASTAARSQFKFEPGRSARGTSIRDSDATLAAIAFVLTLLTLRSYTSTCLSRYWSDLTTRPFGNPVTSIDRYLVVVYARTLLVTFASLVGLYVVIDGANNLDEFWTHGNHRPLEAIKVVAEYYTPRLLQFFDMTSGLLAMLAAAFVLTTIGRTNELTALMAAGIGPARIIRPLLSASILVALLGVANRETGLPRVRDSLAKNAQDWRGETGRKCTPKYDIRTDILISGQSTYANQKRISAPLFRLPVEFKTWGRQITAKDAYFQLATADHPSGYRLAGVKQPANLMQLGTQSLAGKSVLFSPADTPWLKPDECFVASVVTFEQLSTGSAWRQNLSSWELITGLWNQTIEPGADIRLTLHARFVRPLIDLSLVLLGIPLVLSHGSRNIFMASLVGIGLVGAVWLVDAGAGALGRNYLLSAPVAAWIPVLIFGPLAYTFSRPLWD